MEAILTVENFNRMIDAVKRFAAKKDSKPIHQWIRVEFDEGKATAVAVDGYRLAVESAPCYKCDKPFVAYIKPNIGKVLLSHKYVSLALDENRLLISYGDNIVGYQQPEGDFLNWRESYSGICKKDIDFKIGFNPDLLISALQSAKAGKHIVKLNFRSPNDPVVIETGEDSFNLVLPIRLRD